MIEYCTGFEKYCEIFGKIGQKSNDITEFILLR